jgi:hypothetical protein
LWVAAISRHSERTAAQPRRLNRPARQARVGVRLDIELEEELGRNGIEQLAEHEGPLAARLPTSITQAPGEDLGRAALVGPSVERRPQGEQRIVNQDEVVVRRQAEVRLHAIDGPRERAFERRQRGVGTIGAPEPVGYESRGA